MRPARCQAVLCHLHAADDAKRDGCRSPAEGAYSEGFIKSKLTQVRWPASLAFIIPAAAQSCDIALASAEFWHRVPEHQHRLLAEDWGDPGLVRTTLRGLLWVAT